MRPYRTLIAVSVIALGLLFLVPASLGAAAPARGVPAHSTAAAVVPAHVGGFNQAGNVLITDQFNNRVIEVNPLTKQIVWSFGSGNATLCNPGPGAVMGPNWAERLSGGLTLIAGTGVPSGIPGTTACADNRVFVVNQAGTILWQYGQAGVSGSGPNQLNVPTSAIQLPNHDILITDQANNRVIEVNLHHKIVWSFGPTSGPGALNSPNSAELLANGHILIADEGNNRVIEITRGGTIIFQFSHGLGATAFASRLSNGDTLITDAGNNRVLEITHSKHLVFQFFTNGSVGSNPAPAPTNAVRLVGGDTIIADQFNNRVIVIDTSNNIVFQYGVTNVVGSGFNQLFAPYTAFVIGDYTGQTHPPASFHGSGDGDDGGDGGH